MRTPRHRVSAKDHAPKWLLIVAAFLWLAPLAGCDSSTSGPPGNSADVTTNDAAIGSDSVTEDAVTGDGEADGVETDTEEEVTQQEAAAPVPLIPTLAGGTATSSGFSTRFSLTVPVATESAESENYRVNSGQLTIPPAPEEQ